jgi:hypothetical protein
MAARAREQGVQDGQAQDLGDQASVQLRVRRPGANPSTARPPARKGLQSAPTRMNGAQYAGERVLGSRANSRLVWLSAREGASPSCRRR